MWRGDRRGWEGPGSGLSDSSGSSKLGKEIGGVGTLRDGIGNTEGVKVTPGDGGAETERTYSARSGAGGGRTMAWSKIMAWSSMAWSWELPSVSKGVTGVGLERVSARAWAATTLALAEDILVIGQDAGNNCMVLAMGSAWVTGMYTR